MMPRRKAKKAQPKSTNSPALRQTLLPFSPTSKTELEIVDQKSTSESHASKSLSVDLPHRENDTSFVTNHSITNHDDPHLTDDEQFQKTDDNNCPASLNTSSSDGESVVFVSQEQKGDSPLKRDLEGKGLSDCESVEVEKPISPRKRERRALTSPVEPIPLPKAEAIVEPAKVKQEKTVKKAGPRRSQSTGSVRPRGLPPTQQSSPVIDAYNIESYYPVRRSSRREEKAIKESYERDLVRKVLDDVEEGMKVVDFEGKGRGVIATRQFGPNDFVVEYAGDLISIAEADRRNEAYAADPTVGCYMFWIAHAGKKHCIDATAESGRLGRLINHSRKSGNLYPKVKEIDGLPRLLLHASRRIFAGEELLYDYGERAKKTLDDFPWLKT